MKSGYYRQDELLKVDHRPPATGWMDTPVDFRPGSYIYPGKPKNLKILGLPNPREWAVTDEDWKLPDNWKQIVLEGMAERLKKYRSFKLFMDTCVRCGACADKCHFFIGGGDPKNMPVLRAELLRSVYRKDFTALGKVLGKLNGARELTVDVVKEWFYYFYQCTECRRCSVFCPFGIDTAEVTMMGRELLGLLGLYINWAIEPVANCYRFGNHLAIPPHGMVDTLDFMVDDIEEATGIRVEVPLNKKGAEVLFIPPSGDYVAAPGIYTCMGYMLMFHELGLDYTFSTYASEGGNFGLFTSHEMIKRLNSKIYAEARRLGVKWILGGECGHMWRVLHQYMDTVNGPADFLEVPKSPFTGTVFENAKSSKVVHIMEFFADLIRHGQAETGPRPKRPYPRHVPRLLQPGPRHGHPRGAAVRDQERLQQLLRDAGKHDPRADLLLRRRSRTGNRREHGDATPRRAAPGQRREVRAGKTRGQSTRGHVRHRPGDADHRLRLLGPRRTGDRHHGAGG